MTRYFYPASRAHHAYAMALDFGMRFKKRDGLWATESLPEIRGASYQIEVADESLDLLLPRAGDVIRFGDDKRSAEPHLVVEADFSDTEFPDIALLEPSEPS